MDLPQYLKQRYSLYEVAIDRRWFLGILLEDNTDFRPATFEKHLRQIIQHTDNFEGYCLIAEDLPGYVRKRLVERKIPFVVPGLQMFWPELGVAIQSRKAKIDLSPVEVISPATQVVLVLALTGGISEPVTAKVLAERLHYTTMTMSRALDELEGNEIATVERKGRERLLYPDQVKPLWEKALPFMRNPVRETVRIEEKRLPQNMRIAAGETALAKESVLVPPREPVYALGRESWKRIAITTEKIPVEDTGTCLVQLWRYNPALFAVDGSIDPFSLYLSLKDEADERVQSALEEMMEKTLWS
jgi:DNA-binding transcriptional ArsR family regulator